MWCLNIHSHAPCLAKGTKGTRDNEVTEAWRCGTIDDMRAICAGHYPESGRALNECTYERCELDRTGML